MLNFKNILTLKEHVFWKWLLIGGLLVAMIWGWKSSQQTVSHLAVQAKETPDLFFSKFKTTVMDEAGYIHYELAATMLYHYSNNDRATLEFPVITLFKNSEQVWRIRADSGVVINRGGQFILQGGVSLFRQADGLSLKTEMLTIFPEKSIAKTDQLVILTHSQGEIKAVGMQADFSKGQVTLLSQVRGRYERVH